MKFNLLGTILLLTIGASQAQTDVRSQDVRSLFLNNKPYVLQTGVRDVQLKDYSYEEFGSDYLLESSLNDSISYSIVNREDNVSGFIYYPNSTKSIVISTKKGKVLYDEVPTSEVFVSCSFSEEEKEHNATSIEQEQVYPDTYFIGNYATESDVLKLQSKPGAKYLIYLDFDGEPYLKGWESQGFVATAVNNIPVGLKQRIWESVAADFIPFDVNVTNDRALFDAHSTTRKGWAVCADFGSPGWYGVAFRPSFGTGKPALIDLPTSWSGNYNYLFRTPSHELGHALSLSHDGNNLNGDGEYYKGHGEYTPIMGSGNRLVTHWSKGKYSGATNTEDDLSIIHNYLGYSSDDDAGTRLLVLSGENVNSIDNNGVIENNDDVDIWSFEMTGTGDVNLTIDPVLALTDFDASVELRNEFGQIVYESNPTGERKASIQKTLDRGTYYLHVKSGFEYTASSGWTNYGVFGYYDIYGRIENVAREQVDIIALNLSGLEDVCSTTDAIEPQITILNGGELVLTQVEIEVYEDDVLKYTQVENLNLVSDQTKMISLQAILSEGSHTYKLKLVDPNGLEVKVDNNILSGVFNYVNGKEYEFYSDMPFYTGNDGFVWSIKSNSNNQEVYNSSELSVSTNANYITQKMCLATDNCYSIEFSGAIDFCVGSGRWDENKVYNSGDECTYGGYRWRAKWWTQSEQPPAQVWEQVGTCSSQDYDFGVFNLNDQSEVLSLNTATYSNPTTEGFCDGSITGVESDLSEVRFSVFPNPVAHKLNVTVSEPGLVCVYSMLGDKVEEMNIKGSLFIDFNMYPNGAYFVVFSNDRINKSITVVK